MSRTKTYFDLRDALHLAGCPICRLRADFTEHLVEGLIYENVNDPGLRDKIRQARGFCHEHTWCLMRSGAALGVSIIMRDVLNELLRTMEAAQFRAQPVLSLGRVQEALDPLQPKAATAEAVADLGAQVPCPICVRVQELEQACDDALIENLLGDDGLLAAYRSSDGLCLPHFRQALARVNDEAMFDALLEAQQAIWGRLRGQLSEAIRKSDYRFSDEPIGEEAGSWLRAMAATASERNLCGR